MKYVLFMNIKKDIEYHNIMYPVVLYKISWNQRINKCRTIMFFPSSFYMKKNELIIAYLL